ncbi:FlgD immunoglobulin-like domain containing protein [Gilvimarinus algae]|uniref:FlgD immunoglobulin-like domain containing protein n=1 Tax=Gilvimarinus algae TaxID=3058037 RepID=A0ABT8TFS8_9GAMM|nr:FlgD immunoglobulin-like domain containing protein [Gilvimarinus sp. SDUM040014]MDO3382374.1 FlgD immunoglobulin-like domain containing protein [Gilvimarinus sp. SDUM040014]
MKLLAVIKSFMLLSAICISCAVHAVVISNVSTDSTTLNLSNGERVTIQFALDRPASVALNIYDDRDLLVKRITLGQLETGEHKARWKGDDQLGRPVPPEAYRYTLSAVGSDQTTGIYDLSDNSAGQVAPLRNLYWDGSTQSIRYTLAKPARVVIRVGLNNHGPLLHTVVNWVARDAGEHSERWNGSDVSQVISLAEHPRLEIAGDGYRLAENSILVLDTKARSSLHAQSKPQYIEELKWPIEKRMPQQQNQHKTYAPAQRSARKRGDFPLQFSLLDTFPMDNGIPQVSGTVAMRINVNPEDLASIASQRFEPVFFVDGQFLFESEVGYFPMTLNWDSTKHNNGIHYMTANLRGYLSNFGMATIKVEVVNDE